MVKEWTQENISKLIKMYRERPCLWKLNDKNYTNKRVKNRAYDEIVKSLQNDALLRHVDQNAVKLKIQNLRGSYRKELRKVEAFMKNGEDQYEPSLWYFHLLAFTKDQEPPPPGNNNPGDPEVILDVCEETSEDASAEGNRDCERQERPDCDKRPEMFFGEPKRRRVDRSDVSELIQTCTAVLSSPTPISDDCSAFGAYITDKLRKMRGDQQILAEALIQKVITKGMRNQLTDDFDLLENPPP